MKTKPWGFGSEVARKIHVSPGYISRLRGGNRSGITPELLAKLVRAMADTESDRAELIVAHLKDESCGYYPDLIEIKIKRGIKSGISKK